VPLTAHGVFRDIVISAAAAGLAIGLATTVLQAVTTTPLILKAEMYEQQGAPSHSAAHHDGNVPALPAAAAHEAAAAPGSHQHDENGWKPENGLERTAYTALANILVAIAISSVLLGLMVMRGETIDPHRGLIWGIAGFVAGSLLPSIGLPPELPGTPAAGLIARQAWWLTAIAASGSGIALLWLTKQWSWKICGLVLLIMPHAIGAPRAPALEAGYPAGLAGEFAIFSLAVNAFVWAMSGLAVAGIFSRLTAPERLSRNENLPGQAA
jgi:cobalt transporter subunit CbtA